ncbi:MAG: glutamine-hydrolyzing carbamoyl-phosphate synthase small subunit [Candidatus Micrarchaeota archaeon]|nr:glutamine-hydrolyzing carbamoyl-phosphate synthase small subunit [Candidatus Micrarchaeota archaeon]
MGKEKRALLVLRDGSIFPGKGFGAEATSVGELVFNTSFCGYQEALTDPSYAGQILTATYPLIGNYGVNGEDFESDRVQVSGFVAREVCDKPFHMKSKETLDRFLERFDVPGIYDVDTRAVVRKIRNFGVMSACVSVYSGKQPDRDELLSKARKLDYSKIDFVEMVTTKKRKEYWVDGNKEVVLIDCGVKTSIIRELLGRNISVVSIPARTSAEEILSLEPDGILVSNGPGDPALLSYVAKTVRVLMNKLPLFGICLGHQIIAHAVGGKTFKLKFGHRGGNHPVKDLESGRVYITSQNHGYAVDERSLPKEFTVTHRNWNDLTVEGMKHRELPVFSVQYHPEANPGPLDSTYLFDKFLESMK